LAESLGIPPFFVLALRSHVTLDDRGFPDFLFLPAVRKCYSVPLVKALVVRLADYKPDHVKPLLLHE